MTDTNMLTAALEYAAKGLPVFPCWNTPDDEDKHKSPMTPHGFKDATTDPVKIKRWWQKSPNALIGLPTGDISGIAVLDLDIKKGKARIGRRARLLSLRQAVAAHISISMQLTHHTLPKT